MSLFKYKSLSEIPPEEVEYAISKGWFNKTMKRQNAICRALSNGMTQEAAAQAFNVNDDSLVRKIKNKHCPECSGKKMT